MNKPVHLRWTAVAGVGSVVLGILFTALLTAWRLPRVQASTSDHGTVLQVRLDDIVDPVTAEYVTRGIARANEIHAQAVLLELDTPGGLESSMREIIDAIIQSHVPVITYVYPQGSRAASAGLFILVSGDVAVMAPGTHTGAAHPVMIFGSSENKTMEEKIENDSAAYIRSLADRRGRSSKLAEEGVRQSHSYTETEALNGHLIDAVANSPAEIFSRYDGKAIKRFDGSSATLHLAGASLEAYEMTSRERFLALIVDPNVAFLLGAAGLLLLYVEFTHPGAVAPGVIGAIALILALYAFQMLPVNYAGVAMILLGLGLFVLEAKVGSHGVLAVGGIVALVFGSLILVRSPLPGARIHLSTSFAVAIPVAAITVILLRFAIAAHRLKSVTGEAGMLGSLGVAETNLDPEGRILIHGEHWGARSAETIPKGSRVRVLQLDGLTLIVEPASESR